MKKGRSSTIILAYDAGTMIYEAALYIVQGDVNSAEAVLSKLQRTDPAALTLTPFLLSWLARHVEIRVPWLDGGLAIVLPPPLDRRLGRNVTLVNLLNYVCSRNGRVTLVTRSGTTDLMPEASVARATLLTELPKDCLNLLIDETIHEKSFSACINNTILLKIVTSANLTGPEIFKTRTGSNWVDFKLEPTRSCTINPA